ncbi:uncharacterized protein C8Q71DRAFT_873190 [Rhodofomes roseus]|uniref:Uncharacterized protein n=1 Tax=Rhodofomes roseus TaxID=34475 RepID=A0ABQ8KB30_9APHY|nr:uncharacterized protein C8Q71DRAFT_873190 [Rhodofomes roseus]KAH9834663.1 hypothetical protein C8Q71DRAFT_873190 [Rhodofomes roseus]
MADVLHRGTQVRTRTPQLLVSYKRLYSKRYDTRTRVDRTFLREQEWQRQIHKLVDGYLAWSAGEQPQEGNVQPWDVVLISFDTKDIGIVTPASEDELPNESLVRRGYLGTAPIRPSIAIAFRTLEAYRQLHHACPRLSRQALVQTLCHLHRVPLNRTLVNQFSIAYDLYLEILHHVDSRVDSVLGRDATDWPMLNACASCLYRLLDEPSLKYSILVAMDGNQSLKLVDDVFRAGKTLRDDHVGLSRLWLTTEEVNRWKDEVPRSVKGDENSQVDVTTCVERWRNAGPESRKKMFALFAVTGVFVCVCRHGHLLAICDMIRSGELMKYPLAIIDRLMNVYGSDILVGYDIACAFARTVANSSLAQRAKDMRLTGIVPAFHGHGHNRGCQVHWHPRYFIGAGKEDFKGCERLFSASNHLASGTRLASAFHRHQAIVEFFSHWDDSKHAESGNFIYNNYRQALAIRKESAEALEVLCSKLHVTTLDLEHFLDEEREYLRSRKKEPPEVSRKADYMAALKRLEAAGARGGEGRLLHTRQYQLVDDECQAFEDELELEHRWVTGSPEYAQAEEDLAMRNYHLAVDNLERLIVQRLFELTKLGMSGVGYKLREKISKGLKARAEAIKKALTRYNKHAAALVPPRPSLSWDEVLEMVSLAEFDLLRDARTDIRKEPWADRKNREAMNILFDMKRAEEEIERLNVEIPRLLTFMHDDHIDEQGVWWLA